MLSVRPVDVRGATHLPALRVYSFTSGKLLSETHLEAASWFSAFCPHLVVTVAWGHVGPAFWRCDVHLCALQSNALETEKDPFSSSQASGSLGMDVFHFL